MHKHCLSGFINYFLWRQMFLSLLLSAYTYSSAPFPIHNFVCALATERLTNRLTEELTD